MFHALKQTEESGDISTLPSLPLSELHLQWICRLKDFQCKWSKNLPQSPHVTRDSTLCDIFIVLCWAGHSVLSERSNWWPSFSILPPARFENHALRPKIAVHWTPYANQHNVSIYSWYLPEVPLFQETSLPCGAHVGFERWLTATRFYISQQQWFIGRAEHENSLQIVVSIAHQDTGMITRGWFLIVSAQPCTHPNISQQQWPFLTIPHQEDMAISHRKVRFLLKCPRRTQRLILTSKFLCHRPQMCFCTYKMKQGIWSNILYNKRFMVFKLLSGIKYLDLFWWFEIHIFRSFHFDRRVNLLSICLKFISFASQAFQYDFNFLWRFVSGPLYIPNSILLAQTILQ